MSEYANEIENLKRKHEISVKFQLRKLTPFLDNDQIIRVGGRLHYANHIPFDERHPKSYHRTIAILIW